jgi:hypothetical protein
VPPVPGEKWDPELTEPCWAGRVEAVTPNVGVARKEVLVVRFPEKIESFSVLSCFAAMLLVE